MCKFMCRALLVNVVLAIVCSLSCRCFAAWTIEPVDLSGDAGFSLFIDVDPAGSPHVAYYSSGDLKYAKRTTSGWQPVAVLDNADTFAIDDNGDPYFVNTVSPEFYPYLNIRLDSGLVLSQKLASTRIGDVFLDFDSQNRPQIGYVDTTVRQLKHAAWNGTAWTTRTVASSADFRFASSNLTATLDVNDQMHFSWGSFDESVLKYAKPTGTTWQVSNPFGTLDANPYDIDVDAAGNVHLAYNVFTGLVSTGGLFYSQYNGSSWSGGRIPGLDGFGAGRSKLALDDLGQPHLITYDSTFAGPKNLKHVYRVNGTWVNETIDSYTGGSSGPDEIEIMIEESGMHVVYSTGLENTYYAFLSTNATPGDFDSDGDVDGRDFLVWQRNPAIGALPDWQAGYDASVMAAASTSVPEPRITALLIMATSLVTFSPGVRLRLLV